MNINEVFAQQKTLQIMQRFGKRIEETFAGFGFCLIIFKFNEPSLSNYISNARREDMIKALRETADRLEKRQDFNNKEETNK